MKELIKCYCGHTTTCDCGPETLEETAENFWLNDNSMTDNDRISYVTGFGQGIKWQQEKSYSEEDLKEAFQSGFTNGFNMNSVTFEQWFEQYKKK